MLATTLKTDTATYQFPHLDAAYAFSNACGAAKIPASLPTMDGLHRVAVSIATWQIREKVDALAVVGLVVKYEFAS